MAPQQAAQTELHSVAGEIAPLRTQEHKLRDQQRQIDRAREEAVKQE